jgi:hypothetical protein
MPVRATAQCPNPSLDSPSVSTLAACVLVLCSTVTHAATDLCAAKSAATITPVIEVYTSEGCSSCPPADQWASGLKDSATRGLAVVQAFHVGYWDYIGWVDRFASPAHTQRQRDIAAVNQLRSIYTPQVVRNGQDWPRWHQDNARTLAAGEPARVALALQGTQGNAFEATITPTDVNTAWSAYWSVTEHGHNSKVAAGENKGEFLKHDFVVRQYVPVGSYSGNQKLKFSAIAADPKHPRQVNLVVFEPKSGKTLQALSLSCAG